MKKILALGLLITNSISPASLSGDGIISGETNYNDYSGRGSDRYGREYTINAFVMPPQEKSHSVKESLTDGFFEGLKMGAAQLTGLIFIASLKEGLPYAVKYFRGSKAETGLELGQEIALRTNLVMKLGEISEKLKNCDESEKETLELQVNQIKKVLNQLG